MDEDRIERNIYYGDIYAYAFTNFRYGKSIWAHLPSSQYQLPYLPLLSQYQLPTYI